MKRLVCYIHNSKQWKNKEENIFLANSNCMKVTTHFLFYFVSCRITEAKSAKSEAAPFGLNIFLSSSNFPKDWAALEFLLA